MAGVRCYYIVSSSLEHKVTEADNKLGVGKLIPRISPEALNKTDLYAVEKKLHLGSLCEVADTKSWHFWMVMLKNGNYDTKSGLCPENGKKDLWGMDKMRGGFNETYDLGSDIRDGFDGISFFEVVWEKKVGVGHWAFGFLIISSKHQRNIHG
ncbi:hypothetical protein HHK36_008543 [Tetracentron sinense]|uniref:DUF7705 domain-containing protein n=1 Tax=Tetracentron sinense TaxID=13715 RepID=A0A835DK44_TETSI|nr:hypothetical protein HHK36_008543 [Tetracentron sinense]